MLAVLSSHRIHPARICASINVPMSCIGLSSNFYTSVSRKFAQNSAFFQTEGLGALPRVFDSAIPEAEAKKFEVCWRQCRKLIMSHKNHCQYIGRLLARTVWDGRLIPSEAFCPAMFKFLLLSDADLVGSIIFMCFMYTIICLYVMRYTHIV